LKEEPIIGTRSGCCTIHPSPLGSGQIDGLFLIARPNRHLVEYHHNDLLRLLGASVKVVYAETGTTRPGGYRGFEHFGFRDGISQPGIRGLTPRLNPVKRPDQGLPGQGLVWPGEFVFGYPGQDPADPVKAGPPSAIAR
jgi:deferrochelatase/peroxidase EfeB